MIKVSSSKKASRKMLKNPEILRNFVLLSKKHGDFPHFSAILDCEGLYSC
jgi:hypothetical protein